MPQSNLKKKTRNINLNITACADGNIAVSLSVDNEQRFYDLSRDLLFERVTELTNNAIRRACNDLAEFIKREKVR